MGMFDRVLINCPNCGEEIEFQSKAGDCGFNSYYHKKVPVEIAKDLEGQSLECANCTKSVYIASTLIPDFISLRVRLKDKIRGE